MLGGGGEREIFEQFIVIRIIRSASGDEDGCP